MPLRPAGPSVELELSSGCCPGCPSCLPGIRGAGTPMPTLDVKDQPSSSQGAWPRTSRPYGASPFSSLCLTLWKSYLFSCRTKLAKLLCLKCLGRMVFVNFSFYWQRVSQSWQRIHRLTVRGSIYLKDHKAVAVSAPADHIAVRGVFEHSVRDHVSIYQSLLGGNGERDEKVRLLVELAHLDLFGS